MNHRFISVPGTYSTCILGGLGVAKSCFYKMFKDSFTSLTVLRFIQIVYNFLQETLHTFVLFDLLHSGEYCKFASYFRCVWIRIGILIFFKINKKTNFCNIYWKSWYIATACTSQMWVAARIKPKISWSEVTINCFIIIILLLNFRIL